MTMVKNGRHGAILTAIFVATFLTAIAAGIYIFLVKKEYMYIIETSCDPSTEKCFSRDCEGDNADCPPNNYSTYKQFKINASEFQRCLGDNCENYCKTSDHCSEIVCGINSKDECSEKKWTN